MPPTMILELWNCLGEIFNKKHWELHSHQLTDLCPNPSGWHWDVHSCLGQHFVSPGVFPFLVLYVLYPKIHQNLETWNPFKTSHRGKEPKEPLGKPGNETWNIPQGLGIKMGISENSGAPKSPISIGFSSINHPFWGTFIFGNTHLRRVAQMFIEVSWNLKRTCSKNSPSLFRKKPPAQARQSCPWGSHNRDVAGHGKGVRVSVGFYGRFWLSDILSLVGCFFHNFCLSPSVITVFLKKVFFAGGMVGFIGFILSTRPRWWLLRDSCEKILSLFGGLKKTSHCNYPKVHLNRWIEKFSTLVNLSMFLQWVVYDFPKHWSLDHHWSVYIASTPHLVTVTTRVLRFLGSWTPETFTFLCYSWRIDSIYIYL